MRPFSHSVLAHVKNGWQRHKKTILLTSIATTAIVLVVAGGLFGYARLYDGRIYPNVVVNGVDVGGMTVSEATDALEARFQEMLDAGLPVAVDGQTSHVELRSEGATDPDLIYDFMDFNARRAAEGAFAIARTGNLLADQAYSVWLLAAPLAYNEGIVILTQPIEDAFRAAFPDLEEPGSPSRYTISQADDTYDIGFTPAVPGTAFVFDWDALARDASDLTLSTMHVALVVEDDMISESEALALEEDVIAAVENAPYTLTFTAADTREYAWEISQEDLLTALIPMRTDSGDVFVGVEASALADLLAEIHTDVDVAPVDARFQMEDGRVTEFAGHQNGVMFDEDTTLALLNAELGQTEGELAIAVQTTEPEITTDNVNDLGIREVLGIGISDFSGSPSNRIANIRHGAEKLNGLLVPPGETLSLLEKLKPFTIEDGYLPELVIKGDEIKPEVGGGLCQIGTTTFRATMNAGLEVVSRRNHSLVVSYYDDPSNGNPGTDATIYDPAPDYVLRNNTDHYILLTTEVDLDRMELVFTFWGTSDGRTGSYTPPQVLSWSGYGATQYKETTTLAPGVTRCQSPHPGATTTFDYTVEYADGTTHQETFNSTYRSLPRICLVGVTQVGAGEVGEGGEYVGTPEEPAPDDSTPAEPAPELDVEDVPAEPTE